MLGLAEDARFMEVRNDSNTDAPAFAAMKITGTIKDDHSNEIVITVIQPDADSLCRVIFNSGSILKAEARGRASMDMPVLAAYDSTSGLPAAGTQMGTASGEWLLNVGKAGFIANDVTDAVNFIAQVVPAPGGEVADLINFSLAGSLTSGTSSATATLEPGKFWGGSTPATGAGALTVYNTETSDSGVYHFEGVTGDTGIGRKMDIETEFLILELQCADQQFTVEQAGRRSAIRAFAYV